MFLGNFSQSIDVKNRMFIPSKYKDEFGSTVIVAKFSDDHIRLYSEKGWQSFCAQLPAIAGNGGADFIEFVLMNAFEATPDSQGRIVLPLESFVPAATLNKEIHIIGMASYVKIVNEDEYQEECKRMTADDNMERFSAKLNAFLPFI